MTAFQFYLIISVIYHVGGTVGNNSFLKGMSWVWLIIAAIFTLVGTE